tara:strand:- start:34 stop:204 length:171 start_codon:yes stop_codon:yes gene_type:complete
MIITNAKYIISELTEFKTIKATIDDKEFIVPLDTANRHYQAIQEWVAKGNKIEEAD